MNLCGFLYDFTFNMRTVNAKMRRANFKGSVTNRFSHFEETHFGGLVTILILKVV